MKRKIFFQCPLCLKETSCMTNEKKSVQIIHCDEYRKSLVIKIVIYEEYGIEYTDFSFQYEKDLKPIVKYLRGNEKEGNYFDFQRNKNEEGINYENIND